MKREASALIKVKLFLIVGVMSFAFGAILVRYSDAPALVIAFYRLFFATLIMALIGITMSKGSTRLKLRDYLIMSFNGLVLAAHFALWITSLKSTTIAASVILVDTSPFFALFFAYIILKESVNRQYLLGLALCFLGTLLILGSDLDVEGNFVGDLLALGGAVLAGLYFFIGRSVRQRVDFIPYVSNVYGYSSLFLLLFILVSNTPLFGYTKTDYLIFMLLALGPSCLGHNSYNYSLKYMKASTVSATVYGEALGSTLLAVILFNETPPILVILGAFIIMIGFYLSVVRQTS
ncbi:MAG: DMT family transporter [Nitrososphaeria archaeon]